MFGSYDTTPYDCTSGECSWEPFESIGVCSTCRDVTAATNDTMTCVEGHMTHNQSLVTNRTCHYQTPSGYQLDGQASNYGVMRSAWRHHTLWNSTTQLNWRFGNTEDPQFGISTFAALRFSEYDDVAVARPEIWLESAHECTLSWCAKQFGSSAVRAGSLHDEPTLSTLLSSMVSAPCRNVTDGATNAGGVVDHWAYADDDARHFVVAWYKPDDLPYLDCAPGNEPGKDARLLADDPKAFWINDQDEVDLASAIDAIFTTTFETSPRQGDDPARALFKAQSLPQTIELIARSMTNDIRSGPNRTETRGTVFFNEQHMYVRWPWLIMPASLVLLSVGFLGTSMALSARGSRTWKTSALPSLYYGRCAWEDDELHDASMEEMRRVALDARVRFLEDDNGTPSLVRVDR